VEEVSEEQDAKGVDPTENGIEALECVRGGAARHRNP
jgi:hypothetical protein